ncbi:hypothetical protein VCX22_22990 [Aeromonas caviae]|uniref:hypothetical protein n=1 Tax=Aeromonas caviae TaxID=648 RepID=UPI002B245EF4|nr:hypothetical protein [Aeromonas caviae]MEA9420239.1 hypothetical protein [Aeromonas caviae]
MIDFNNKGFFKLKQNSEYAEKVTALLLEDEKIIDSYKSMRDGVVFTREGANKRGNSSRLTQSFHFFMFEPIFSPVNALNQPI